MGHTLARIAGLVVLAGFFLMVLHSVSQAAGRAAPASKRIPAGVTNELLFVVGVVLALGFYRLAEAVNIFSWVQSLAGGNPSAATIFVTAGPSLASALLAFLAVHRLAVGRSRQALWQALVLLWCASVGHTLLRPVVTGLAQEPGEAAVMAVAAVVCTVCLAVSRRVKNTYLP